MQRIQIVIILIATLGIAGLVIYFLTREKKYATVIDPVTKQKVQVLVDPKTGKPKVTIDKYGVPRMIKKPETG